MPCECGCGVNTGAGQFLPGHDQTLRTALAAEVEGLLALRTLVQLAQAYSSGERSSEAFTQDFRAIFANSRNREPR